MVAPIDRRGDAYPAGGGFCAMFRVRVRTLSEGICGERRGAWGTSVAIFGQRKREVQ